MAMSIQQGKNFEIIHSKWRKYVDNAILNGYNERELNITLLTERKNDMTTYMVEWNFIETKYNGLSPEWIRMGFKTKEEAIEFAKNNTTDGIVIPMTEIKR